MTDASYIIDKIKATVWSKRMEADGLYDLADFIEEAWKDRDWNTLVNLGVIKKREADILEEYGSIPPWRR